MPPPLTGFRTKYDLALQEKLYPRSSRDLGIHYKRKRL